MKDPSDLKMIASLREQSGVTWEEVRPVTAGHLSGCVALFPCGKPLGGFIAHVVFTVAHEALSPS